MQLFCKGGVVVAWHDDDQTVPASAYGDGVTVAPWSGGMSALGRVGTAPPAGQIDTRPYAAPTLGAEDLATAIADECSRRIYAQVSAAAQQNIAAYATKLAKDAAVLGLTLTAAQKSDLATADAILEWISAPLNSGDTAVGMLQTCRNLIAAGDQDYAEDSKWPAWDPSSAGWSSFVARF